ncbi:MAG: iron chelate uptake ABC transporter family permease subunit, partial [Angustibacter sp.]
LIMGLSISTFFIAVTSWLLVLGNIADAQRATSWLTGSLSAARWSLTLPLLLLLLVSCPALPVVSRHLAVIRLGPQVAQCLGVNVARWTVLLLVLAIAWVSLSTAAAGPISFIAFAAPLFARRITGPGPASLWQNGLLGGALLLAADLLSRVALNGTVPVGVITGALGGALLLVLVLRNNLEG